MKFELFAGNHTRKNCPVSFKIPTETISTAEEARKYMLKTEDGAILPCDCLEKDGKVQISFVVDYIGKSESVKLSLEATEEKARPRLRCVRTEREVSIYDEDKFVTQYYIGTDIPKPYLGPLRELYGSDITRLDFETKEHPHHRGVWVSHGEVNGVDTWNEPAGRHGFIKNLEIKDIYDGDCFAGFTAKNLWTDFSGKPLCEEETTYTFYAGCPELTLFDMSITLVASYGDVTLGATKEAGPLAVRMAESIKVMETGTMVNGAGGVNEKEIWMKRAPWVDYYGKASGKVCGIAILDNPENDAYPAWWHARDYGLMAPNNFHVGGERVISQGESMTWKYRIAAHNGDTKQAGIEGLFVDYISPPEIKAE